MSTPIDELLLQEEIVPINVFLIRTQSILNEIDRDLEVY